MENQFIWKNRCQTYRLRKRQGQLSQTSVGESLLEFYVLNPFSGKEEEGVVTSGKSQNLRVSDLHKQKSMDSQSPSLLCTLTILLIWYGTEALSDIKGTVDIIYVTMGWKCPTKSCPHTRMLHPELLKNSICPFRHFPHRE